MQTKQSTLYSIFRGAVVLIFFTIFLTSCGGDDDPAPAAVPDFTYVVDEATGLKVTFTNTSQNGVSYSWNFGVTGATSTVESPEYTYTASGAYTVVLTATNADGKTATKSKTVALTAIPQNVLANGEFTDNSAWIIHDTPTQENGDGTDYTYGNIWTFADGKLTISGNYVSPDGVGASRTMGTIYQAVELEAGTYEMTGDFFTRGHGEPWMWIQLQKEAPMVDAFPEEGGEGNIPLIGIDFGACPNDFSGNVLGFTCRWDDGAFDTDGIAEITTPGTYYFVLTAGQWESTFGTMGFNNISLKKIL